MAEIGHTVRAIAEGHIPATDANVLLLPDDGREAQLIVSTYMDRQNEPVGGDIALRADEGVILYKEAL